MPEGQPKTQEAMIDQNIREDTPNIMVSNQASIDQPPSKGSSFMNVQEGADESKIDLEQVQKDIENQDISIIEGKEVLPPEDELDQA